MSTDSTKSQDSARFEQVVQRDGVSYIFIWNEYIMDNGEPSGSYWVHLYEEEDVDRKNDLLSSSNYHSDEGKLANSILDEVVESVLAKVRKPYLEAIEAGTMTAGDAVVDLYQRSQTNEFLGQSPSTGRYFVQNVAQALQMSMSDALDVVDELNKARRIGLNGFILVSIEDEDRAYEYSRKATGHLRLRSSDMGSWFCSACGQEGWDGDSPTAVPCVSE